MGLQHQLVPEQVEGCGDGSIGRVSPIGRVGPGGAGRYRPCRGEHPELARLERTAVRADGPLAGQGVGQGVEIVAPGQLELGAGGEGGVDHGDGGVGGTGAPSRCVRGGGELAGDDAQQDTAVG